MEKQKVTVEFQNKFCDKLYNTVQKAEFDWLKRFAPDKKEHWNNLIGTVDFAIYRVIKEFFDNGCDSHNGSWRENKYADMDILEAVAEIQKDLRK